MIRSRFLTLTAGVLTLTAALLTAVFTGSASACQCYPGEQEPQRYARVDVVFTGVVLDKVAVPNSPDYPGDDQYRYTFRVGTEYKGDVPATVNVLTTQYGTACGVTGLVVGVDYLVFAYDYDGVYQFRSCDGTRPASGGPPITGTADNVAAVAMPCAAAA